MECKGCSSSSEKAEKDGDLRFDRSEEKLHERLGKIKHKVVVLSGKGGVGKSTVAVNLATSLAKMGKRVGLLDVDIHGPSIPTMLGLEDQVLGGTDDSLDPVEIGDLKVISMGFVLKRLDEAVIWRGPLKMSVIKQFLKDVNWGELDYLIIDCPPGTGDEPLSVCQLIDSLDGAVIVTTPQRVAAVDVQKSITFCRNLQLNVIGIVENMSGFVCPHCNEKTDILPPGGGKITAEKMGVRFLGAIPMDPGIARACDEGLVSSMLKEESPLFQVTRKIIEAIPMRTSPTTACSVA
jgi:ATP-binding protein involved in chromosome partitioning